MDWDKRKYSKTGRLRLGYSRTSNVNTKLFTSGVVGKKEVARKRLLDKHGPGSLEQIYKKQTNMVTKPQMNCTEIKPAHQDKGRAILVVSFRVHIEQKSYNFKKFHLFIKDGVFNSANILSHKSIYKQYCSRAPSGDR